MTNNNELFDILKKSRDKTNTIISGIKELSFEKIKTALELKNEEIDQNTKVDKLKNFTYALSEFISNKDFDKNKNLDYFKITSEICNPVIYAFLCWTLGKKEQAKEILSLHDFSLTEDQYNDLVELLNPYNSRNDYYILDFNEQKKIKSDEKREFIFLQSKLKLNYDLSNELSLTKKLKNISKFKV